MQMCVLQFRQSYGGVGNRTGWCGSSEGQKARPSTEGEARAEGEARDKAGKGSGEGAR